MHKLMQDCGLGAPATPDQLSLWFPPETPPDASTCANPAATEAAGFASFTRHIDKYGFGSSFQDWASRAEDKGPCAECGQPVLSNQERLKAAGGNSYVHAACSGGAGT